MQLKLKPLTSISQNLRFYLFHILLLLSSDAYLDLRSHHCCSAWFVLLGGSHAPFHPSVKLTLCLCNWCVSPSNRFPDDLPLTCVRTFPPFIRSACVCPWLLSEPSLSDRAPQRAAIMQKRRRWKVGKVFIQLSPILHAHLMSFSVQIRQKMKTIIHFIEKRLSGDPRIKKMCCKEEQEKRFWKDEF